MHNSYALAYQELVRVADVHASEGVYSYSTCSEYVLMCASVVSADVLA